MKGSGLADSPFFVKQKNNEKRQPGNHNTMVSRNHDALILDIAKSLSEVGKEASTYRLTYGEKKILAEIIFSFRLKNIRVSENEIIRIAIHSLFYDHKMNRKNSILLKVVNLSNSTKGRLG